MSTDLGNVMRQLADTHSRAPELREKAKAFDEAAAGYYSETPTVTAKQFLGAWARAQKLYSDCSGEALV